MTPHLKPIEPKTPRWEPAADPSTITVPGLDTTASVNDQIEQIEQLITIKLQVSYPTRFHGYSSFVFLVLVLGGPGGRVGAHGARGGRLRTRAHATKVGPWGGRGGGASALSFLCAHWGRCVDWRHRHRMFGEVPGEEEKQANRSPSPWTRYAVLALASDSGYG